MPIKENFSLEKDQLLALFELREEIKIQDVQAYLKVSRNTASRRLSQLLAQKHIKRVGKGPAVKYVKV